MESLCLSKHKSSLLILMMMMILSLMVGWIEGVCMDDERKALLQIKASLHQIPYLSNVKNSYPLPTWVGNGECCDWERITCNPTTGYITHISLTDITSTEYNSYIYMHMDRILDRMWSLKFSTFVYFKELQSLDLSWCYIHNAEGFESLGSLKKLEILNLSNNYIETNIFPSLGALTSLKILDLSYMMSFVGSTPTPYDISEFPGLENLELLALSGCGCYGSFQMQGSGNVSLLEKLKVLNLADNEFNESLITSLSALPSLTTLDLSRNFLFGSFPTQELSHMPKLEKLDLHFNRLDNTPSIQGCKRLMSLKRLESVSLGGNGFNKSIISCLSFLPSLKILDLRLSQLGSSFPMQELSSLKELKTLDLSDCSLESLTSNGTMSNLLHLDLSFNYFKDNDIMTSMTAFPSLRFLSLEMSNLGGRLFANGAPTLPDLEVLLLGQNNFHGTLPIEGLSSFHHLKVLELNNNGFVGSIPSTIASLSSLKFVSFSYNKLNGSLSHHGLCELKNLHELDLSHNMFDGNLPNCFKRLSSLKFLDISSNQFKGGLNPSLVTNLRSLEYIDFSHNKFEGSFSFSSFSSHAKIEYVSFINDNDKFKVETEEPIGWSPMFQLKVLVLSNCNIKMPEGSVVPHFLLHQNKLEKLELSDNSLKGKFPDWLIENNTMLEVVNLRRNLLNNVPFTSLYRKPRIRWVDMSENRVEGVIPRDVQKYLPNIEYLNLSRNSLKGSIPSTIGDLDNLMVLDLSHNQLSGEVPTALFTNLTSLFTLMLSNNSLQGEVLSRNLSTSYIENLHLDGNLFTGNIGNKSIFHILNILDIGNNLFTGVIPDWISNVSYLTELVVRNNRFRGQFPCGCAPLSFLDISQNYFSGIIPSCMNFQSLEHLHLASNKFTGAIPSSYRNMTNVLTLDIGNNNLSSSIPEFLGELSNLRILLLRENNFNGSIPKELCLLTNASLIDLSSNSLSGSIPSCLQNMSGPIYQAFIQTSVTLTAGSFFYHYSSILYGKSYIPDVFEKFNTQDEVLFTTKRLSLSYKGGALNYMSGLDLSCNKLTGDIPEELGRLTHIHALNLSHNRLTGPIPPKLSNLANIESLDLSFNGLTGEVPSELSKLNSLAVFNVSFNNLSGRLPEMIAQFGTFSKESYEGNPLLCGLPLDNKCTVPESDRLMHPSNGEKDDEKWYDMDMTSFYGSCGSTWFVFLLGFAAVLYVNPYWRRRWFTFVEECMYTSFYFLYDLVRKLFMLFCK